MGLQKEKVMEANVNTPAIGDVVRQFEKLTVEDYQRTYAWDKAEIEEFFGDLVETATTGEHHFFGTLIMQSTGQGHASVVDGQQRLTTTYVTVAALRDAAMNLSTAIINQPGRLPIDVAAEAWKFLVPGNNPQVPRFESNRFLRGILTSVVLAPPEHQVEIPQRAAQISLKFRKCIRTIRALIRDDLDNHETEQAKLERIYVLLRTLLEKFLVLRVVTESMNESLDIFLTLNNRGLPLGPSDLVRGHIMSARGIHATDRQRQALYAQIFEEWKDISELVEEPEVFLRHYLVATGNRGVTKKHVVDRVLDRIRDHNNRLDAHKAAVFWADLQNAARVYERIINAPMEGNANYCLYILNGLLKSHRIFMLGLYRRGYAENDFSTAVRLLNVLCLRWNMAGKNAQQLEDFFQELCIDMADNLEASAIHNKLREKNEEFDFDLKKFLSNEGDSGFVGKAILHGLNRRLNNGAINFPIGKKLHLEHIAPQTPTSEWLAEVFAGETQLYDEYENVVSEIGNLTLLDPGINIPAGNRSFREKTESYYPFSTIQLTLDLNNFDIWTKEDIESRTAWVAEMFDRIWHSSPANGNVLTFSDWISNR